MEQGSKEWLELRRTKIGASDAPIIMGVSPWKTPYQLWAEKLGIGQEQEETSGMMYGKKMEPEIRKAISEELGIDVEPRVIFHPMHAFMMASLDGISLLGDIYEIKVANKEDHEIARSGNIPDKYFPQCQHQMSCAGVSSMTYVSYNSGEIISVTVEADSDYINDMIAKEKEFFRCMTEFDPPELTHRDAVENTSEEWVILAKEAERVIKEKQFLEKYLDDIKAKLVKMAGTRSTYGGGIALTRTPYAGRIDYKAIPELEGVDLEKYRKKGSMIWRLTAKACMQ